MAIDMTTVKKIVKPGNIYVKRIFLTNNAVVYKGSSTPCPVKITLFSKTTDIPTITASNLYDVLGECGYTKASNNRYYLTVDNPYEFIYNTGTYNCVFASFQSQSASYPVVMFFSVPGQSTASVGTNWTITEEPWVDIGYMITYDYEYKSYINSTAGSYTNFTVGKDEYGNEQIANYCVNGSSYPEVTIVSVSGDTYTLSNQEVITISADHSSVIESGNEVREIFDGDGNRIWEKPAPVIIGYYIKQGSYYINKGSGTSVNVITSTTASTVWKIENDNRVSCTVSGTKYYLQCGTGGSRIVYADTSVDSYYVWIYKSGNYITANISGTTYYLYRYGSGNQGVRMRTNATTLTFEPVYQ